MGGYSVVPEFRFSKFFPLLAGAYQLIAVGFFAFGYFITSAGLMLSCIFQLCSLYYVGLFLCDKFYRLIISPDQITVQNIFGKQKTYRVDNLRWSIGRIPWYNSYYVLLYSSGRNPIAVVRPHWKNVPRILHFPHSGKLSSQEIEYLKFLKSVGLMK